MVFKKTGDAMPVLAYYGKDGEREECSKCGEKLIVVAIDADDNKLVCGFCDIDYESIDTDE
ncbi:MAG TPA: hypothetical protein ENI23_00410 [bacterium]|nr:hypothetical protein [bacterium]